MRDSGNGQHDDQRYRTDQRLFRQHDLPCDQRSPGCPAGDQGTSPGGNAGSRLCAQHQRTAAQDPAVAQPGVRGQRHPQSLLLGLLSPAAAGRYPVRIQRHRLLSGRERQRDRRSRKDPAGDQAQRHDLSGRQRSQLQKRFCQHHSPLGADHTGLRRAGLSQSFHGGRG